MPSLYECGTVDWFGKAKEPCNRVSNQFMTDTNSPATTFWRLKMRESVFLTIWLKKRIVSFGASITYYVLCKSFEISIDVFFISIRINIGAKLKIIFDNEWR